MLGDRIISESAKFIAILKKWFDTLSPLVWTRSGAFIKNLAVSIKRWWVWIMVRIHSDAEILGGKTAMAYRRISLYPSVSLKNQGGPERMVKSLRSVRFGSSSFIWEEWKAAGFYQPTRGDDQPGCTDTRPQDRRSPPPPGLTPVGQRRFCLWRESSD